MSGIWIGALLALAIVVRVVRFRRRRGRGESTARPDPSDAAPGAEPWFARLGPTPAAVEMVARREIRERVRGRIFKVGTLVVLLVVVAAIVLPSIHGRSGPNVQTVGVVGRLGAEDAKVLDVAAKANGDEVRVVRFGTVAAAEAALRSNRIDVALVDGDELVLNEPATAGNSPADPGFVSDVATYLGQLRALQAAGVTPGQARTIEHALPLAVRLLTPGEKTSTQGTSIIGLVLLFFMLSQYNTWILIGVMQEKASRVVEVLLSTLRPIQLLAGKVLGIGLVALGQATLVVCVALLTAWAVGSDVLHGTAPLVLVCQLIWLVFGYAFYCWVYAAAGSTAERQDQVQTLALPLSIPVLIGYIFSITVVSTGNASLLFKVLAYLPPTAPFCMPVLVALRDVSWWQFVGSLLITLVSTVFVARFAARIYRGAILRTRGRVKLRELLGRTRA